MSRYDAHEIEPKWQKAWADAGTFEAKPDTEAKPRARRTRKTPAKSQDANDKD